MEPCSFISTGCRSPLDKSAELAGPEERRGFNPTCIEKMLAQWDAVPGEVFHEKHSFNAEATELPNLPKAALHAHSFYNLEIQDSQTPCQGPTTPAPILNHSPQKPIYTRSSCIVLTQAEDPPAALRPAPRRERPRTSCQARALASTTFQKTHHLGVCLDSDIMSHQHFRHD